MTKKAPIIILICGIILSMGWVSCSKKEDVATPFSRVLGKWKKVQFATDDNGNGILDEWERRDMPANITNIMEFKKDSTGVETATFSPELPFRWLIGGDVSLMTIYNTGDSIAYKVMLVTSANLQLSTKTSKGLAGYYYDKTN